MNFPLILLYFLVFRLISSLVLEHPSFSTQDSCDMAGENSGWTLIACSSNNDAKKKLDQKQRWMLVRPNIYRRSDHRPRKQLRHDLACRLVGKRHREVQDHTQRRPEPHSTAAHHEWVAGRTGIRLKDDELWRLQRRWAGPGQQRVPRGLWRVVWRSVQSDQGICCKVRP